MKIHTTSNYTRFWSKVDRRNKNKCWEWQSCVNKRGYGMFWLGGRSNLAHRVAWYLTYGTWSTMFLLHTCDNTLCVNPSHLFEGTGSDNAKDRDAKGRQAVGSKHGKTKLIEEDVRIIKNLINSKAADTKIASRFNVHYSTIRDIRVGKTWRSV